MHLRSIMFASIALFLGYATQANASSENRFPYCESERVLKKVVYRFNQTEKIYWRSRALVMGEVINPHQHSENPFPDSPINRRYCHADATFENGRTRRIHYLIEQGAGFAGFGWNVEYCVHGLDPWKYYDGRCRVLSR